MATLTHPDSYYIDSIRSAPDLSPASKRSYLARVAVLQRLGRVPTGVRARRAAAAAATDVPISIDYLVRHPKPVYALICLHSTEPMSRTSYINTIMTIYRHIPALAERYPDELAAWRAFHAAEAVIANKRYEDNRPTDRQRAAFVAWPDVLKAREALPHDSIEYLVLCMHSMIAPIRADLDRIPILNAFPCAKQELVEPNYIVMHADSRRITLVITAFKAKTERMSRYSKDLPPALCTVIEASLRASPRSFLFVQPRSGEPFTASNTYSVFANRIFKKIFDRPMTVGLLRHSFITGLPAKLKAGVRDAIARDLLHSPAMMSRYAFFFDDEGEFDMNAMTAIV